MIAIPEDPQAIEGQKFVELVDGAALGGQERGEAAGGDDENLGADLLADPIHQTVHQPDIAEYDARLYRVNGVATDGARRLLHLDAGELRGPGEEGVGADTDAGGDAASEVLTTLGDAVEGRGRAEVDDDDGAVG